MTIKERIEVFIERQGIKRSVFEKSCGFSNGYTRNLQENPSGSKIEDILKTYPELNRVWLLTGEGEMLNEETAQHPQSETIIPLLPVEAMAGSLSEWSESVGINNCIMIPSPIPSADYAMQVSGDSMEPELHNGSYIYIKKINSRLFIPWGAILVVDTENGVVVKRVYPVDDDDTVILAKSINPKYPPFKIPLNSVYNMFRVLGSTRILSTL